MHIAVLGVKGMPYPGGIERVMEQICSRLAKRGHQIDVYVRKYYMQKNHEKEYRGMRLLKSRGIHSKHLDALTHSVTALMHILLSNVDIVYINSIGLSPLAILPRIFGKKAILQTHGLDWRREKWGKIATLFLRLTAFSSVYFPNKTLCVSLQDKRFLEQTFDRQCIFIPNGVDLKPAVKPMLISQQFALSTHSYILFMARLVPEKGCHYLIEAWKQIPETLRRGKILIIAGDNDHKDRYYYSLKSEANESILFTGFVTGRLKQELLSNAYCFIQPSTIEGMSISILEALSYGRFVLASDIPENKDALQGCGMTFQTGNVSDLTDKLCTILSNPELINTECNGAIELVRRNYNWDKIVDTLEKELLEI